MTHKELMIQLLTDHGTSKTKTLGDLSGLSRNLCHNALKSLLRDGLVSYERKGLDVYWTPLGDDLEPKQIWGAYVPPKVTHSHPLMTAWFN
jgi:hypothetical protein